MKRNRNPLTEKEIFRLLMDTSCTVQYVAEVIESKEIVEDYKSEIMNNIHTAMEYLKKIENSFM